MAGYSTHPKESQTIRATTDASGSYTWTFPNPYPVGVVPIVTASVEDPTADSISSIKVVSISNTSATVRINETAGVTVLGVGVLALSAPSATVIHLTAHAP